MEEDRTFEESETMEITEKMDGSLGIVFVWQGQIRVSTRSKIDSIQARWASSWIQKYVPAYF